MDTFIQKLDRIILKIDNFCSVISGVFICLMVLLVTLEVILRNFFTSSTLIADEYAGYFLVGMVFFGVAYTYRVRGFIRVDMIYRKFGGKLKFIVDLVLFVIALIYVIILFRYITEFTLQSYHFDSSSTFFSRTPLFIPQSLMVVGLITLILEIGINLIKHIFGLDTVSTALETEEEGGNHI